MKKFFVQLVSNFIIYKPWRKFIRRFLMSFKIRMLPDYWRIILMPVPAKTVLLIEPNDCHGEVLPGLARYFADLGYSVRVILSAYNFAQAPFCRMPEVKVFCLNDTLLSYFVRKHKNKIEAYDALVLTSSSFYCLEMR